MQAADPSRRVVLSGAYGYTVFVRPPSARPTSPFDNFERRALEAGRIAVIDCKVIEPGSARKTTHN